MGPSDPNPETLLWLEAFTGKSLMQSRGYAIDRISVPIKLDQNECPWDWPETLKEAVTDELKHKPWNRYPEPYSGDLPDMVARYAGVAADQVLLTPGSDSAIGLMIDAFGRSDKGRVIFAQPSFPLYQAHCAYAGVDSAPWNLDNQLNYQLDLLPDCPPQSLVFFASPNNPVGNTLSKQDLKTLLTNHPDVLFVADEAYFEFADEPFTDMLPDFRNLMILRTFSKSMGAAGARVGYVLADPAIIEQLRKPLPPYILNHFSVIALTKLLNDKDAQAHFKKRVDDAISERERVRKALGDVPQSITVYPSQANFLLVRWPDHDQCQLAYRQLIEEGILVRNVSRGALSGCLRITMGTREENDALLTALSKIAGRS